MSTKKYDPSKVTATFTTADGRKITLQPMTDVVFTEEEFVEEVEGFSSMYHEVEPPPEQGDEYEAFKRAEEARKRENP